jgi:D-lyxose ketol-isomerase
MKPILHFDIRFFQAYNRHNILYAKYEDAEVITRSQLKEQQQKAFNLFKTAGLHLTEEERDRIEVADFGLGAPDSEGAQIFTFVQTNRYAAKIIGLLPGQTLPEHWHPPVGEDPGKQETVRVAWGRLYFCADGPDTLKEGRIIPGKQAVYTARCESVFDPGATRTFQPGEKHWFQGGPGGVVFYSFSSVVRDALDGFSDPAIQRSTRIVED